MQYYGRAFCYVCATINAASKIFVFATIVSPYFNPITAENLSSFDVFGLIYIDITIGKIKNLWIIGAGATCIKLYESNFLNALQWSDEEETWMFSLHMMGEKIWKYSNYLKLFLILLLLQTGLFMRNLTMILTGRCNNWSCTDCWNT